MVKYENEFGEVKKNKKTVVPVSETVYNDLNALKAYADEPINCVIERLLQSMHPKEMTEAIVKKVRRADAKMGQAWKKRLEPQYEMVQRRQIDRKEWIKRLYEQALSEVE